MKEKFKVLIVDDDKSSRELVGQILKKKPEFHLREAKNGKDALKMIDRSVPDIVLCDLDMSGINAIEFCQTLKGDPDSELAYYIPIE